MKTNLLKSIFISLILLMGVSNAWANGGIGYKGVKFTKDGTTTGWYNIHNVTWDYAHSSYECRSGKSGVTDFNNADLGIVTSLNLHSFVVIGWTDNSDWVSGQLKYRTYLQSASAGNYNVYNVGNYETYCNATDVLVTSGNNRVVGKNGTMNVTLVDNNTTPGKYYLQLQGMGRMRYCNGDFNTNNGSEVKASYTVPGFAKTTASQAFGSVNVGSDLSKTISFTNHYGTKLTTSNCVLSGTNKSEFSVTSISETGVTVKFTPSSSGSKSATLTITDAHSKKCTITLSGTATLPTYTVTFNANGHGTAPAAQTVSQGSKATQPTAPTTTGYTFGGWYKESNCANAFDFNTAITDNITLYAKWTANTNTAYTVKHCKEALDGTYPAELTETENLTGTTDAKVTPAVKSYTGFTAPATQTVTIKADGSLVVTYKYSRNSYQLIWDVNEGNALTGTYTSGSVKYEASINKPADPTREGYTFNGWHDGTAIVTPAATMPDNDLTYTAQWQKKKYTVTYGVVGSANGTIALNGETPAIKDLNKQDLEHGATLTFTATPANGYRVQEPQGWFSDEAGKISLGNGTAKTYNINSLTDAASVFVAFEKIPASTYIVTFDANGGSGTMNSQSFTENVPQNLAVNEFTRTGYTFSGWNTQANGSGTSYTDGQSVTLTTAGLTLYAQWTANQYTITFDKQNGTGGTDNVTVHYDNNDYSVKPIAVPSIPGYGFMGYYVAKNGSGFQVVDATGNWVANAHGYTDTDGKWKNANNTILYAHFQKAQIATLTLDNTLFGSGATGYVTTSHTISPVPAGTVVVCWTLCYNNGTPVVGHDPIAQGNEVKFAIDGLRAGTYKVVAELHLNDCNGELLDTKEVSFVVAGSYTVTIQYTCGGETINASIKQSGNPTTTTPATAPEIGGYNFVKWVLGDGITTEDDLTSKTINYKAAYDGYLTATYEKKKLIFLDLSTLPNKSAWTAPHVYLYSSNDYWNDTKGVGAKNSPCVAKVAMVQVPTATDIWYYEYEEVPNFNGFVAFTATDKKDQEYFWDTEVIYRGDFSMGTPVFVPSAEQKAVSRNSANSKDAKYYSKGHWTKYMGGTGYTLKIYNHIEEKDRKELMSVPFIGSSLRLPFTAVANLETNQTYGYKIVRDNEKWYKNDADNTMTTDNHKNWPFIEDNSNGLPCGLQTVAAGDYTFTLTLNATSGNLEVSVEYPVTVGDYRVLYKDNTRATYKPSQIIKKEDTEPIVGYFVRPGNNPELKVQTAARVTSEGVTWTTTENEIFFKPNANWKSDGARFAAWFSGDKWKDLNKNGDVYSCEIPSGATEVIFCRMDPKKAANTWSNKWNQTGHLSLTTDNIYTLKEGEWGNKLYLKPNSNWLQKNDQQVSPRFAAYFFNSDSENRWMSMSEVGSGIYSCDIPAENYKKVIFCRMNGNQTDDNWNNKWNQSSDLAVPTDGKTLYTVKDATWDKGGGSWSEKEGSWTKLDGGLTDLSSSLTAKLAELETPADAVYTIYLSADGTSIEKVEPYTGNYYIRVDAADGKWYDYKTNPDNLMTYSAYSENEVVALDGEATYKSPYSHYKTAWCTEGQNVKFVIANDYSQCISDTLVQDSQFNNIDEHGNLKSDNGKYNANIRFMWNRKNNKVSRAYLAAATDQSRDFLVLKSNSTIKDTKDQTIADSKVLFDDTQNWIYETTVKVQPGTLFKLYACYPTTDVDKALYFRGEYASNSWAEDNTSELLGGKGDTWYTVRVIYDFKTNRLMTAWIPDNVDINGTLAINADVMVTRSHHDDAKCITFANDKSSLTAIKTVYGTLQFNRWILNNRANPNDLTVESCTKQEGNHRVFDEATTNTHHAPLPLAEQKSLYERGLYFVSFPFDVNLSDVFGFGTYGTHWVISKYNGLRRAQNGYFIDNCVNDDCTNWDYIWDPDEFVMKANEGYLLSLDLDLMKYNNIDFWQNNRATVELYFPSMANVETIAQTSYTMPALDEKYKCTIDYSHIEGKTDSDRRVKDSYWRCIGVPSFADYNSTLTTDGETAITWKPKDTEFPFLYEWNVSDNSLMVRAASTYKFRPTFAYLVQNGKQIHWSAVNSKPSSIVARQRGEEQESNYEWRITLSRDENQEDQTFVRMTDYEEVTTAFDFNQDLIKELNYGRSDIYTLIGYERAAANSMPLSDSTTVVPLGLDIEQDGDYTIAMPEGVESVGVTLLDAETGERINLSIGMDYTISLNKGACHNRLYLEISPIQQTTTDIEYTDQGTREQSVRKVLIDGKLYIVCDGVVYDAQGKRL